MTLARSVADVLSDHVTLEIESIDRMYLNLYVPKLQYESGIVGYFRGHLGYTFASWPSWTRSPRTSSSPSSVSARPKGST